ncbi:MAG: alkaline phosphatase [Chitinophagaceae bacterium]|nr:alkaline phosphatase [Chitinophagaceae bacterium]
MTCRILVILMFLQEMVTAQISVTGKSSPSVFSPDAPQKANVYTTANAHSHNDYENKLPFTSAYQEKFGSMEADIFLSHDSLIVGHTPADIVRKRTLEKLYLDPLLQKTRSNKGFPYSDTSLSLQLLIDVKTEALNTLDKCIEILKKYPELTSSSRIRFVITGNRPPADTYQKYPSFILFDGEFLKQYSDAALQRVPLFSDNLKTYLSWNGNGAIVPNEKVILDSLIGKAHAMNKNIRFWNAPDSPEAWRQLMNAGVDYLNTDHIAEISAFLSSGKFKK